MRGEETVKRTMSRVEEHASIAHERSGRREIFDRVTESIFGLPNIGFNDLTVVLSLQQPLPMGFFGSLFQWFTGSVLELLCSPPCSSHTQAFFLKTGRGRRRRSPGPLLVPTSTFTLALITLQASGKTSFVNVITSGQVSRPDHHRGPHGSRAMATLISGVKT